MAGTEQADEQRLRASAGERRSLHLRCYEPPDGQAFGSLMRLFRQFLDGVLGSWSTRTTGGAMRSGYSDGPLALGVLGCERPEPFARLLELVGPLDGNPERPCLQQSSEPLQVLLARHSPDVVALRPFTGRRERRGPAPVVL